MGLSISGSDPKRAPTLEQLYRQYGRLMYHVSFQILHDPYLAEDAVQAAFLKLTKNRFSIESIDDNKTKYFMVIVVRNSSFEIYNKKKKDSLSPEEDIQLVADETPSPLDIVLGRESVTHVQGALQTMDKKYSDIVIMRYVYDYSTAEIAALFGITEQLVRVRLHRARKMLTDRLYGEQ